MKARWSIIVILLIGGCLSLVLLANGTPRLAAQDERLKPVVSYPAKHDTSPALREIKPPPGTSAPKGVLREIPLGRLPRSSRNAPTLPSTTRDVVQQGQAGALAMPSPLVNFEGINNINSVLPPDTQGDVGYDPATGKKYYVQWVNLSYAIWDVTVTPTQVFGPVNGNTLWQGFGGDCENTNNGDPITLYDSIAHRWFMSQFAWQDSVNGPFSQCIAVSQTADPLGQWYRYAYTFTTMNDYSKFGVWPDGYYMTMNQFTNASTNGVWAGAGVVVLERDKMLNGQSARMVYFDLFNVNPDLGGMLPADLDGLTLPPSGSPDYFAEVDDSALNTSVPTDVLRLWQFHVDWTNTANSTFGINGQANYTLTVAPFTSLPCVAEESAACIPQPATSQRLDSLGDRAMYRLAYRNFGDHESLVVNHTVQVDGADRAGVRWYEVRNPGSSPVIYQQGTFAPADGLYRWMGSVAMDHDGDMALGYSVSSGSIYPSIRYTGRLAGDPLGQMAQGEAVIITGTGAQTHTGARWGDYSMMTIDPLDDCTFWYTNEYIQTTGSAPWQTRIAAWKFPTCNVGWSALNGIVTDSVSSNPVAGAQVTAMLDSGYSASAVSGSDGAYALAVLSGTYTVTASAHGYLSQTIGGVSVTIGMTTVQNFSLVAERGLSIQPPMPHSDIPGRLVTYTLGVTNTSILSDTFTVTISDNTWPAIAPPTLGPLDGGAFAQTIVTVSIPLTATPGTTDTATVTLTSQGDNNKSAATTLTTSAGYPYYFPLVFKN